MVEATAGAEATEKAWPYFVITAPRTLSDDEAALLTQAATDAGALGAEQPGAAELRIYLPAEDDAGVRAGVHAALATLCGALGLPAPTDEARRLPDAAWATAWKEHFRSFALGERFAVRPNWELGQPAPEGLGERLPIFLLPGQAFGTGTHETTRLALTLLEQHIRPGDRVLDFGAGSAILAIAAAQLGAAEVIGIEHDPDALPNARENLELNGVAGKVRMLLADVPEAAAGSFNLIVCNILPQYALPHLPGLARALHSPQSTLIYSGFLADEVDGIESQAGLAGLSTLSTHRDGPWGGLVARQT